MSIHTATLQLVKVNNITNIIIGKNATYKEAINFREEFRILPDNEIPNSNGYPTLLEYLSGELESGYGLKHIDQYNVITTKENNNQELIVLESSARTSTSVSSDQFNFNSRGIAVYLDITAQSGGQIDSIEIQAKVNSNYFTVAQFASLAIATTGVRGFLAYPGAATLGSWTLQPIQTILPITWRIQITHGNASSITYSVIANTMI